MELLPHQIAALNRTALFSRVAYYHDMGLGKTFVGAEKMHRIGNICNLLVCQKSKISDWMEHFAKHYPQYQIYDLTDKKQYGAFFVYPRQKIGVINYELTYRREELLHIHDFTLVLDESSLIQNDTAKRTKFISKLQFSAVVLLSGTPVGGKYENLLSQLRLLGVSMTKGQYWTQFVNYRIANFGGFPQKIPVSYKNTETLKKLLIEHGADFIKTEEVITLPPVRALFIYCAIDGHYKTLLHESVLQMGDIVLEADNPFKKMLYLRQLCSITYNISKREKLADLIASTNDRIVIFYNWYDELNALCDILGDRPVSIVNGQQKDLSAYDQHGNSVTLVQYQAGAMGLNLQKARIMIYVSLPLSSELYEQSKKRIHRVGQRQSCLYYLLLCTDSIEIRIHETLKRRQNYTNELFMRDYVC